MAMQYHKAVAPRRGSSAGFTLMEVLVTIVILSIGLLGVAGLQFNSLRGNQNALESSVAVALAMEGADRVRSNLPGVRTSDSGAPSGSAYDLLNAAGSDPGCISSGCSVTQIAQTDAYEWISRVETLLPGGEGAICRDSTPNDGTSATNHGCDQDPTSYSFAIKVWWDHDRDPATQMMAYRMSLNP